MKLRFFAILILSVVGTIFVDLVCADSTRKERMLINKGNDLYKDRKYGEAQKRYEEALRENAGSAEARYNLGLSQVRQIANPADTTAKNRQLMDQALKNFSEVASLAKTKPGLAAKANYNMGNLEFNAKDFQKAVEYYKQALRIDPSDDRARKNLRIAQKNLQKQNQDQNKNQNQDQNKDQDKEKNKDQNKQKNQQNKDQDNKKENEKQQNDKQNLSQQSASQILQAIDNKESATRARVNKANKGEKSEAAGRNTRRW